MKQRPVNSREVGDVLRRLLNEGRSDERVDLRRFGLTLGGLPAFDQLRGRWRELIRADLRKLMPRGEDGM